MGSYASVEQRDDDTQNEPPGEAVEHPDETDEKPSLARESFRDGQSIKEEQGRMGHDAGESIEEDIEKDTGDVAKRQSLSSSTRTTRYIAASDASKNSKGPVLQSAHARLLSDGSASRLMAMSLRVQERMAANNHKKLLGDIRDAVIRYKSLMRHTPDIGRQDPGHEDQDFAWANFEMTFEAFLGSDAELERLAERLQQQHSTVNKNDAEILRLMASYASDQSTPGEDHWTASDTSSYTSTPRRELDPKLKSYYERLGDYKLEKDRRHNLNHDHGRLRQERINCALAGIPPKSTDKDFVDAFFRDYTAVQSRIRQAKTDIRRLKAEYEQAGGTVPDSDVLSLSPASSEGMATPAIENGSAQDANYRKFAKFYLESFGSLLEDDKTASNSSLFAVSGVNRGNELSEDRVSSWLSQLHGTEAVDLDLTVRARTKSEEIIARKTPSSVSTVDPGLSEDGPESLSRQETISGGLPATSATRGFEGSTKRIKRRWSASCLDRKVEGLLTDAPPPA